MKWCRSTMCWNFSWRHILNFRVFTRYLQKKLWWQSSYILRRPQNLTLSQFLETPKKEDDFIECLWPPQKTSTLWQLRKYNFMKRQLFEASCLKIRKPFQKEFQPIEWPFWGFTNGSVGQICMIYLQKRQQQKKFVQLFNQNMWIFMSTYFTLYL